MNIFYCKPESKILLSATIATLCVAALSGCGGSGSGADPVVSFKPFFVYTANQGTSDISVFQGAKDGSLTFLRKVPSPSAPTKLVVSGTTLYAACDFKLEVFSGAASGKLSLIQTIVTDQKNSDYYPFSMAFGYSTTYPDPGKLYVLGTTTAAGGSELQTYTIGANGTLTLKTILDQFTGQGAIATLPAAAEREGVDLIGVTGIANSLSIVVDDDKTQTVAKTIKLSKAVVGILSSIQGDQSDNFYVADQLSNSITQVELPRFNATQATVVKSILVGTAPVYVGTDSHPGFIPASYIYSANPQLSSLSNYVLDDGFSGLDFIRVSGGDPDAGSDVTSVNGILTPAGSGTEAFVYSTNKSGNLRSYSGPGGQTLVHNHDYDTQGTGVVDVAVTSEIGSDSGGTTGGTGGGAGPYVEYFNGAYLAGSTDITVNDLHQSPQTISLGALSQPSSLAGETSTTLTAKTSAGTTIATASQTYSKSNRYLVLVAADKFGSAIDTYAYANNTYPTASNEWIVMFNGIPDFISGMDFYVLGPGKTLQNSTPAASNVNPGVGAFISIPATLGKFTIVATYAGGKSATDVISTSASQSSAGGTSIVADLANVNEVYTFVFASETKAGSSVERSLPAAQPAIRPIRRR